MMGRQVASQAPLFYSFDLEAHVPANHLLRGIDEFLDLSELHAHLAPHYSQTGRPSIDPALLIRMLIVGYCFGIRIGAEAVRRGAPEPGVPLVLPPGPRASGAGALDLFQEPTRSLP